MVSAPKHYSFAYYTESHTVSLGDLNIYLEKYSIWTIDIIINTRRPIGRWTARQRRRHVVRGNVRITLITGIEKNASFVCCLGLWLYKSRHNWKPLTGNDILQVRLNILFLVVFDHYIIDSSWPPESVRQ